jgi:chemotaxis protein MotA
LDISTIGGLALAWGGLILSIFIEGNFEVHAITAFFNLPAFMLIAAFTGGAVIISYPMAIMKNVPNILKKAFIEDHYNPLDTIKMMVNFATKARREGLLGLEEDIASLEDPFLKKGLQLVVDGTEMEMVRNILEADMAAMEERHRTGEGVFSSAGGFSPTAGIVGTVAGLIHALASITDASKISGAIAVAFLATFYGISFANIIFLPLGAKLKFRNQEEVVVRQLMMDGILSISAGDNPRIVEEKLKAYLAPDLKAQLDAAAAAGAEAK